MAKYYFTYGLENHPFRGGWTEVEAPDQGAAIKAFQEAHPDGRGGLLNCAAIYTEELFQGTRMCCHGNFGGYCHERLVVE